MFLEEGWGFATDDPYLCVRGLLSKDGSHHCCQAAEVDLDFEMERLARGSGNGEGIFGLRREDKSHHARLGGRDQHGNDGLLCLGRDIRDDDWDHSICKVRRQVEMARVYLFLAILAFRPDRDLFLAAIDGHIDWMREERAFLDVAIGDEAKDVALRVDGSFIVDGTIFEMEDGVRGDPISVGDLD